MSVGGHGAARRGATRSVIQASESKGLGGLGGVFKALVDPTNSRFQTRVAVLLLAFEATLLALIIERVPCTCIHLLSTSLAFNRPPTTLRTHGPITMTTV